MSLECRVLILDDEESIRFSLREILERNAYVVEAFGDPFDALRALGDFRPSIVLSDYSLPKMDGLEFMDKVHEADPDVLVLFMTAYGTEELAVEAMKRGAYDYFKKPFRNDAVLVSVGKARERLELVEENRRLRSEAHRGEGQEFVGESEPIRKVFDVVDRIAGTGVTVLLTGESGTGKELVATAIHRRSDRAGRPFVKLNCAAIPEHLVESELFGYEEGAFSGAATGGRKGKFEQADGGTLFLDEIGDMTLSTQTKVLRVLQEREIERLGSNEVRHVDVRILAATHQDLEERVRRGAFREDLYYRLKVMTLELPALRDRKEDVSLLVDHFLGVYAEKFDVPVPEVTEEERARLRDHPWPGNVRELENAVARGVLLGSFEGIPDPQARGVLAGAEAAGDGSREGGRAEGEGTAARDLPAELEEAYAAAMPYKEAKRRLLDHFETRYLTRVLERAGGNVSKAARDAGIHRKNFYEKMQRLGLDEER